MLLPPYARSPTVQCRGTIVPGAEHHPLTNQSSPLLPGPLPPLSLLPGPLLSSSSNAGAVALAVAAAVAAAVAVAVAVADAVADAEVGVPRLESSGAATGCGPELTPMFTAVSGSTSVPTG